MTILGLVDLGHGRGLLRSDAAGSLFRIDAALGRPCQVTSAERSIATQENLIHRYYVEGGAANRPPYLYPPARPATASPHVYDPATGKGGVAIDTQDHNWINAHPGYGFLHDVASDVPHEVYHPEHDAHAGGTPAGQGVNSQIEAEQSFLNAFRGEALKVDGVRGPKTIAAFERYQTFLRAYGYTGKIDGIWGGGTQAAHAAYYATLSPVAHTGALSFADIQRGLNKFGYALVVDNKWGPKSHAALGDFQRRHGLVVDYLVGKKTRAALGI